MEKKSKFIPPNKIKLILETDTSIEYFAMSTTIDPVTFLPVSNPDFERLIGVLNQPIGGIHDYIFVSPKNASSLADIATGESLQDLNGVISTGNGKDNVDLSASEGTNLVFTGNGMDSVTGGSGDDAINTGNARDLLCGGDDGGLFSRAIDPVSLATTINIQVGDMLTGGKGSDTFLYSSGDGVDLINDFKVGLDTLILKDIRRDDLLYFVDDGDLHLGVNDGSGGFAQDSLIILKDISDFEEFIGRSTLFI